MNVNTVRRIDYYAGLPLTFIGTLIDKALRPFRTTLERPHNVLLVELSEMGSAILVDPAMRKLKSQIDGELCFVIFKKNKPSLQLLGTVKEENIFTIDESGLGALTWTTLKFLVWCRRKKIDAVIDLELFSRFTALLSGFSGASRRVGFYRFHNEGLYRGDFLTHKIAYNPHQHITKNFIAMVDALFMPTMQVPFTKRVIGDDETVLAKAAVSDADKAAVRAVIAEHFSGFDAQPIILVNSNASDLLPQRRWQPENYCTLIKKMLDYAPDALVLLTGAPAESEGIQKLADCVDDPRCINFAGAVKFLQLPHLYSISAFMITNDSGPAHFAAVTDMHTYVLFGPETPALYGSLGPTTPIFAGMACSPCVSASNHRETPCTDNQCLQVITPDRVFETVRARLDTMKDT